MSKNYKKILILLMMTTIVMPLLSCKKVIEIKEKVFPGKTETEKNSTKKDSEKETNESEIKEIPSYQTIASGTYFDTLSQRATMDVSFKEGQYHFVVNWSSSVSENTSWTFSGKYDKFNNLISYENCKCVNTVYDENGNVVNEIVGFTEGNGVIKYENKKLYWVDANTEKYNDNNYNGIFEKPDDEIVDGFTNTYNITNNYYVQPGYIPQNIPQQGYVPNYQQEPAYFVILTYDKEATNYNNGAPMVTRMPIIGSNYSNLAKAANNIIPSAYNNIKSWIANNVSFTKYEDYYLNYAKIVSQSQNELILNVNCSLKRKGILSEHITFRIKLLLDSNWYEWEKITDSLSRRVY